MASKNQKIIRIKGGTRQFRKGGIREVELFCQQFEKEHPNAVRIDGDFRKNRTHYSTVYEIHALSPNSKKPFNYSYIYTRYCEMSPDDEQRYKDLMWVQN